MANGDGEDTAVNAAQGPVAAQGAEVPDAEALDETPVDLEAVAAEAERFLGGADTSEELRRAVQAVFGKRAPLARASRRLGRLAPSERRAVGARLTEVRRRLEAAAEDRRVQLAESERRAALAIDRLDLTEVMPDAVYGPIGRGHLHVVTRTREALEDTFVAMGFEVVEGPEAETDWYNFEALNMPPGHPARGMWDTFYLRLGAPGTVLLRAHTSPVQVRLMEAAVRDGTLPIHAVMPGRCYRRETPDARHLPIFHQIEGLVIDRDVTFGDLAGTIETFTTAYFGPEIRSRLRPAYFPFTEPSAEVEITCTICLGTGCRTCSGSGWVELAGCGMVDPAVMHAVHIDPEEWSGFAFGFGIDRAAAMRHRIADLRVLMENDVRFLRQL